MASRAASKRPQASPSKPSSPVKSKISTNIASVARTRSPAKPDHSNQHSGPSSSAPAMSIREAIALKRAEAKKAVEGRARQGGRNGIESLEDAIATIEMTQKEDDDILGRGSLRDVIERAKSTGSVNLAARALPCIPSGLFEIHLGVTPDRLKSVTEEPPLPPAHTQASPSRRGRRDAPAWYESQDLLVLKAANNEIMEIQHEISMFGSLKTVDLHKNRLVSLPDSFADLSALTHLDLSHNSLTSLPKNIFALPELVTLNISHNELSSLPFSSPFANMSGSRSRSNQNTGSFFLPTITRATSPLPRLTTLDASHNQISGDAIDLSLPSGVVKLDLSSNPLSSLNPEVLNALAALSKLKELRLEKAGVTNAVFPLAPFSAPSFPSLRLIDLGETNVTSDAAQTALGGLGRQLSFEPTREEPPESVLQVIVGKRIIREAWEIEIEQRAKSRVKSQSQDDRKPPPESAPRPEVVKEAWEIEAEQGLLTEGGRRRARAAAAVVEANKLPDTGNEASQPSLPASSPKSSVSVLSNVQYYSQATQTLTLPPSFPPTKSPGHSRTFSAAITSASRSLASSSTTDVMVPAPTLPLALIIQQPFAQTLKTLVLSKRRLDKSFDLPVADGPNSCLPCLEELNLTGCDLEDNIPISRQRAEPNVAVPQRTNEPLLPLIARLFPSLRILDLSYNALTSASMAAENLTQIILSDTSGNPPRKGLTHLRLQGNKISDLDGFTKVAELFKGNRDVPTWKMEELDLRDNEISKLPPELGLLPLDVFLVDGNVFRVPQRRVWEREGTKGLLSWLRGRIE